MSQLENDRFIRALFREPVDCTPVWMMRQAGRYLPEYRKVREKAGDFMSLCQNPELACEVTLQPLQRYAFDAAILFSDILTIPDAMGLGLYFTPGEGPQFDNPITSRADIDNLPIPDPLDDIAYVPAAVRTIKRELQQQVPLIGFSGSPWTLATYMVEGKSSKTFSKIKGLLYEDPNCLHALLDKLAQSVTQYLNAQIHAGVDCVMIFDTWGGVLSTPAYEAFSLAYMKKIIAGLELNYEGRRIPSIVFTKNGGLWLEKIAAIGCDAVGLDWTIEMDLAKERIGDQVALQGNMDPCVLYSSPDAIRSEVQRILTSYGQGSGHVFNLGHGIHPEISPEHVACFVDAVHELSQTVPSLD